MTGNEETKAKIEKAALDEFMEKGFYQEATIHFECKIPLSKPFFVNQKR